MRLNFDSLFNLFRRLPPATPPSKPLPTPKPRLHPPNAEVVRRATWFAEHDWASEHRAAYEAWWDRLADKKRKLATKTHHAQTEVIQAREAREERDAAERRSAF
jgi:hypothetical protein